MKTKVTDAPLVPQVVFSAFSALPAFSAYLMSFFFLMEGCQNKIEPHPENMQQSPPLYTPGAPSGATSLFFLTSNTASFLKGRVADAGALSESEKCPVAAGASIYLTTVAQEAELEHVKVVLASSLPGCSLQSGFLYKAHFSGSGFAQADKSRLVGSEAAKKLVQQMISNRKDTLTGRSICLASSWTGLCHPCVASGMELAGIWPAGKYGAGNDNPNAFYAGWRTSGLKLESVLEKYNRDENKAPAGTILLWSKCSESHATAGHIAVVVETGKRSISDTNEQPILNCRSAGGQLREMLYPVD